MTTKEYLPTYDADDPPRKRFGLINLSVFCDRVGLRETAVVLAQSAKAVINELFKQSVTEKQIDEIKL